MFLRAAVSENVANMFAMYYRRAVMSQALRGSIRRIRNQVVLLRVTLSYLSHGYVRI